MEAMTSIASKIGIKPHQFEPYGHYKAKLSLDLIDEKKTSQNTLILISALSPTPAGEGKTTTTIGLLDGLRSLGKNAIAALREPSLGPVFGMKGGATGGGLSQITPMEDINLHFTGDFAAIEKAHNLLAAIIDNTLHHKNMPFSLDPETISWKRVIDLNDRALRQIRIGTGGSLCGVERSTGFDITAASEVMAILCLSHNLNELKERLGNIYIGQTFDEKPVYAKDLHAPGPMATLLKDAIKPNLVQTLEGNPVLVHGGPFANIAHGCNSIIATKTAMSLSDYTITEAGFGCDLGAEKFLHIKCRNAQIAPSTIVIVATLRALKYHGGLPLNELSSKNLKALENGFCNLQKHIENCQQLQIPPVVSINKFKHDHDDELQWLLKQCSAMKVPAYICDAWSQGGKGATQLAQGILDTIVSTKKMTWRPLYQNNESVSEKIKKIVTLHYGGHSVEYSFKAQQQILKIDALKLNHLPICMAKTEKSFSDFPKNIGRPQGFTLHIRDIEIAAGAGYLIPIAGKIMRMPGLPSRPSSETIDINENYEVRGLF